jgi:transcription elongation factor SPT6
LIGKKLYIGRDSYDSLNDIIDKYLEPCNQLMQQTIAERKFIKTTDQDYIKNLLIEDKTNNPQHIPYYFSCAEQFPQYVQLQYIARNFEIVLELVKIKPQGLSFHALNFVSLPMVISYFKEKFKSPEYQKFVKKVLL